jgi:hypothetical protein
MFVARGLFVVRRTSRPREKCPDDQHCKGDSCSAGDPGCTNGDMRPRRTSASGAWSGLRIKVNTFAEHIPPISADEYSPGVIVSTATSKR